MDDKKNLLKKLEIAQSNIDELEWYIKENKDNEEKHRKNAIVTNCVTFGLYLFFGFIGQPLLVAASLTYNLINMIVRANLMSKAEKNYSAAEERLKDFKTLESMYENEISYLQSIPVIDENKITQENQKIVESSKSNKQNKKK